MVCARTVRWTAGQPTCADPRRHIRNTPPVHLQRFQRAPPRHASSDEPFLIVTETISRPEEKSSTCLPRCARPRLRHRVEDGRRSSISYLTCSNEFLRRLAVRDSFSAAFSTPRAGGTFRTIAPVTAK